MAEYSFVDNTFMVPYTKDVADYCEHFSCDDDLDDFFSHDVFLYEEELLGKTNRENQREIVAIATLSFDGIKAYTLDNPSRNALQRKIPQPKRHRSYPAVLIGRLGVNQAFQGQGLNIGTQLMNALKYWFVDENNKAACRYMLWMPTTTILQSTTTLKMALSRFINLSKVRKMLSVYPMTMF